MEVSSLRDRRLVALFATVIIVGSGAAAAVIGLEGSGGYHSPAASELPFDPPVPGPPETPGAPPVVVVVEEAPVGPAAGAPATTSRTPLPAPDPCAGVDATLGPTAKDDCAEPRTPEPRSPRAEKADKADRGPGGGVVMAAEPDPTSESEPEAKPERDVKPKPAAEPEPVLQPTPEPAPRDDDGARWRPAPKPEPQVVASPEPTPRVNEGPKLRSAPKPVPAPKVKGR